MSEHQSMIETAARQQIAQRIAAASTRRLADHLPAARRHRLGLGLARRGDRLDS